MLLLMVGMQKVTLNTKNILGGQNVKKCKKIAKKYEKNQFHQLFIKCFGHKHNTMLPCHVIVAAKYLKSYFEQNKIY